MKMVYDYSEQEAKEYAKEAAKTVEWRTYEDKCSKDTMRGTTQAEFTILENAICAALLAIRARYDKESAIATAEFYVIHSTGRNRGFYDSHINTYGSVCIPICNFLRGKEKQVYD
jgi:hypothetical protein